jgi:hypothetical protein
MKVATVALNLPPFEVCLIGFTNSGYRLESEEMQNRSYSLRRAGVRDSHCARLCCVAETRSVACVDVLDPAWSIGYYLK